MRVRLMVLLLALLLAGCGSSLRECIFSELQTERLSYDGINFNLVLVGNGSTTGAVFDDSSDGIPLAPDFRMQKNFTNTGGSYIQQSYTSLEPGTYRVNITGSRDTASRELTFRAGTSVMIQAECP